MPLNEPHEQPGGETTEPKWLQYKPGGRDVAEAEIEHVIHRSKRGAIYLAKGENLLWDEEENLGAHWTRSTAEAINLLTPVKLTIKDPADRSRALKMLAAGLSRALKKEADEPDEDFLASAREFIIARQLEGLQIWYFIAAVITVVVTTAALATVAYVIPIAREFVIAALLGGVGAIVSVSQRFRSIPIERYTSRRFTAIGGCSRIIFGCMFGAVFLLFQKAEVLLNVADSHPFLLAAAAFVAGFSERAIPEVLAKFEPQIALSKTSDT